MKAADPYGGSAASMRHWGKIGPGVRKRDHAGKPSLTFFYRDGARLADFHAGFAAKTFFFIDGSGFTVLQLVHFHRAYIHAFATASTFVGIDSNIPTHCSLQLFFRRRAPLEAELALAPLIPA
jgi:hypothetical protein